MLLYREKLLSSGQLKRLSEHQYSCENVSFLDPYFQPFWNFLVSHTPLWLAPNLITVSGLLVNIITTLVLVASSPDARQEPPRWACFLCGLGLFIYQSLDAIDGKQARRTGTSSPLGELFDHGCDSISTVFVALSACIAVKLGDYPTWMFFQCFCAVVLFYCAHWQTYVSGTMKFGKVDVTEAQMCIIAIHLISSVFGANIWTTQIDLGFPWEFRYIVALTTILCCSFNVYSVFKTIMTGGVGKNGSTVAIMGCPLYLFVVTLSTIGYIGNFCFVCKSFGSGGAGKNGSTVAGTSVLSPIIPLSFAVVPAYIIYKKSDSQLYENHPALYILAFGLVSAKVTNRLVVAHMTKNSLDYLDSALIGPAMLFLNQYFNYFIPEYYVLWACLVWVTIDLLRYSMKICLEICDHLKVNLFRIPYPNTGIIKLPTRGESSSSSNGQPDDEEADQVADWHRKSTDQEDSIPLISTQH